MCICVFLSTIKASAVWNASAASLCSEHYVVCSWKYCFPEKLCISSKIIQNQLIQIFGYKSVQLITDNWRKKHRRTWCYSSINSSTLNKFLSIDRNKVSFHQMNRSSSLWRCWWTSQFNSPIFMLGYVSKKGHIKNNTYWQGDTAII